LQLGGSDQWGNITTGTELIRRKTGGEAFAITCPLITKPDGSKFGKTESGNVWLDAAYTSPYKFYQFWLNVSDAEAEKYLKIFTFLTKEEIEALVAEHAADPGLRPLQKRLAREVTVMVHGEDNYNAAVEASQILFSNKAGETLKHIDEKTLLDVFDGVPTFQVEKSLIEGGVHILELLATHTSIFPSKGEARKMVQGGGVSLNKTKVTDINATVGADELIQGKYLLVQRGKKNYYLVVAQ
jgi:tyrosyl-tRNA synthetase